MQKYAFMLITQIGIRKNVTFYQWIAPIETHHDNDMILDCEETKTPEAHANSTQKEPMLIKRPYIRDIVA